MFFIANFILITSYYRFGYMARFLEKTNVMEGQSLNMTCSAKTVVNEGTNNCVTWVEISKTDTKNHKDNVIALYHKSRNPREQFNGPSTWKYSMTGANADNGSQCNDIDTMQILIHIPHVHLQDSGEYTCFLESNATFDLVETLYVIPKVSAMRIRKLLNVDIPGPGDVRDPVEPIANMSRPGDVRDPAEPIANMSRPGDVRDPVEPIANMSRPGDVRDPVEPIANMSRPGDVRDPVEPIANMSNPGDVRDQVETTPKITRPIDIVRELEEPIHNISKLIDIRDLVPPMPNIPRRGDVRDPVEPTPKSVNETSVEETSADESNTTITVRGDNHSTKATNSVILLPLICSYLCFDIVFTCE